MARICIDDELHADVRFKRLVKDLGDEDRATGMLYRFWRQAQDLWGDDELMLFSEFELDGFLPLLKVGFALQKGEHIYARGSEERFEWYRQRKVASAKGVQARLEKKTRLTETESRLTETTLPVNPNADAVVISNADSNANAVAVVDPVGRLPAGGMATLHGQFGKEFIEQHLKDAVACFDIKPAEEKKNTTLLKSVQRYLKNERDNPRRPRAGPSKDFDVKALIEKHEAELGGS